LERAGLEPAPTGGDMVQFRVCVGAGSKPALVPNSPDVVLCHAYCVPQNGLQTCDAATEQNSEDISSQSCDNFHHPSKDMF
jgi:hypothetical protein